MSIFQTKLEIVTNGRGLTDLTEKIKKTVNDVAINTGLCHLFLHHTSASLILCENADPLVQKDLEVFLERLIPDGQSYTYFHTAEGPDDMPSHIRTVLTGSFLVLPITHNKLALGTWQGVYLWEHRYESHHRYLTVTNYA